MKQLKWLTAYQIVIKEAILFIHKIKNDNTPMSITQFYSFSLSNTQNICYTRKVIVNDNHPSNSSKKSLIYFGNYLFNKLPIDVRTKNPKQLSKYLQSDLGFISLLTGLSILNQAEYYLNQILNKTNYLKCASTVKCQNLGIRHHIVNLLMYI